MLFFLLLAPPFPSILIPWVSNITPFLCPGVGQSRSRGQVNLEKISHL